MSSCKICGGKGHFARACFKAKKSNSNQRHADTLQLSNSMYFGTIIIDSCKEKIFQKPRVTTWFQLVTIAHCAIHFKIDSGAEADTIPWDTLEKIGKPQRMRPVDLNVISYGGYTWKPLGQIDLDTTIGRMTLRINSLVVKSGCSPLMCLDTAINFNLVQRILVGSSIETCGDVHKSPISRGVG